MIARSHVNIYYDLGIKVSKDGKYIASAQSSFPGFPADVIIWDFETS